MATINANQLVERVVASVRANPVYSGLAVTVSALGLGWYDDELQI